jgi:hypothetical protein
MSGAKREGRTPKKASLLRFVLLTGIPGTGKTTLGNYLRDERGFEHLDFETEQLRRYLPNGVDLDTSQVAQLKREGRDVVISWGFSPHKQVAAVVALRDLGFRWIWFDGDRVAARRAFLNRGNKREERLDRQLARIEAHIDLAALAPIEIDPFDGAGEFRPLETLAADVLG